MNRKLRYLLGFILILVFGFIFFVLTTTFRTSLQYYVTVNELFADEVKYRDANLKVAGQAHDIQQVQEAGGTKYLFTVNGDGKTLPVVYKGFVPDTFKEGSEVVVTGRWQADGSFVATDILAKCASKYEAKLRE